MRGEVCCRLRMRTSRSSCRAVSNLRRKGARRKQPRRLPQGVRMARVVLESRVRKQQKQRQSLRHKLESSAGSFLVEVGLNHS